jgi:hypothetical protein
VIPSAGGVQETLSWQAFSVGGHDRRHRSNGQQGTGEREKNIAMPQWRAVVWLCPVLLGIFASGTRNPTGGRKGLLKNPARDAAPTARPSSTTARQS